MTWNIVTASFNSTNYKRGQRFIDKLSTKLGVKHFAFDKDDLYKSQFYKDNKDWFKTSPPTKKENKYGSVCLETPVHP